MTGVLLKFADEIRVCLKIGQNNLNYMKPYIFVKMSFRVWSCYSSFYVLYAERTLDLKVTIESDRFNDLCISHLGNIDQLKVIDLTIYIFPF